jgi:hypothetical protein
MEAYSYSKHPDAGVNAERLLKRMRDLKDKYDIPNLEINRQVMNCVMHAWTLSGDEDAGLRAEVILANLERGYASGNLDLKPDTRSYGLALNAWSKSSTYGKAGRALDILRRMQKQRQDGNASVDPNEHAYSLVINSCAFSNESEDEQKEAFEIATTLFDEMIQSDNIEPSSLTFGWFMQACARLHKADAASRQEWLMKAFKLCCERGLVNDFVLARFGAAATEEMYREAIAPAELSLPKDNTYPRVSVSQLPKEWTRKRFEKRRTDLERQSPWEPAR